MRDRELTEEEKALQEEMMRSMRERARREMAAVRESVACGGKPPRWMEDGGSWTEREFSSLLRKCGRAAKRHWSGLPKGHKALPPGGVRIAVDIPLEEGGDLARYVAAGRDGDSPLGTMVYPFKGGGGRCLVAEGFITPEGKVMVNVRESMVADEGG